MHDVFRKIMHLALLKSKPLALYFKPLLLKPHSVAEYPLPIYSSARQSPDTRG